MACDRNQGLAGIGASRNGITKLASKAAYSAGPSLFSGVGWWNNAGTAVGGFIGAGCGTLVGVPIAGGLMGAMVGGTINQAFDSVMTRRRRIAMAKVWNNRDIEAENRHIAEAKAQGRFYDNLNRRTVPKKYIVAGISEGCRFAGPLGQPTIDKLEFYDWKEAVSMANDVFDKHTIWEIKVNKPTDFSSGNAADSKVSPTTTYKLTNMNTDETFILSEEPYGHRPEPMLNGGIKMEAERPEADQFHEIVDTRSNRVELE